MADARNTMMEPAIEELLDRTDSKFTLVILAARRGREINSYFNQLGEGLGSLVPPQVASVAHKPLSIAFEEIAADKVTYRRTDADEEQASDGEAGESAHSEADGGGAPGDGASPGDGAAS